VKTLAQLRDGLPEGLSREQALAWLREANETIEAAVGLIATPEQMRKISSDDWHRLKEADPVAIGDLVREAHRLFRLRYPD
jgi:hypothetical protein